MPPVVLELMYLVFEGATKVQNYNRFILMHKAMLEALSVLNRFPFGSVMEMAF